MAIFGLFDRCGCCGKIKLASRLDSNYMCEACVEELRTRRKTRAEQDKNRNSAWNSSAFKQQFSDPLDNAPSRYNLTVPMVRDDGVLVYRYPNVSISDVNRSVLRYIATEKSYVMTVSVSNNGDVLVMKDGALVAKIEENKKMCADWLAKNLPIHCEIASFTAGSEKVALFFYRDDEAQLKNFSCEVVKLTGCMANSRQEAIALLEKGQKLFVDEDDDECPYIRDIEYHPIGKLPAKFNRMYDDGLLFGLFFDHAEEKRSDDFDVNVKYIPYVRVYFELNK